MFVAPDVRAELLLENPSDDYAALESFALRGHFRLEDERLDGEPTAPVSYQVINQCRLGHHKANAKQTLDNADWLQQYAAAKGEQVLDYQFNGPFDSGNKTRAITLKSLASAYKLRSRRRWSQADSDVHIKTGLPRGNYAMPERTPTFIQDQKWILDYFKRHARTSNYILETHNIDAAQDWAEQQYPDNSDTNIVTLMRLGAQVQSCKDGQLPWYSPAANRHTSRLGDANTGWQLMPSAMRRILRPDWVDLDLRAAHLAIHQVICRRLALETPMLDIVLESTDGSVWPQVIKLLNAGTALDKDQLKEAVYSQMYGARAQKMIQLLVANNVPSELASTISRSPLAKELRATCKAIAQRAKRMGHLVDAYGVPTQLGNMNPSTLAHFIASTYELRLMARAYEEARLVCDLGYVAIHSHDGITIGSSNPTDLTTFASKLCAAVDAEAAALGVRTKFVAK
jgi:hypothetical protein